MRGHWDRLPGRTAHVQTAAELCSGVGRGRCRAAVRRAAPDDFRLYELASEIFTATWQRHGEAASQAAARTLTAGGKGAALQKRTAAAHGERGVNGARSGSRSRAGGEGSMRRLKGRAGRTAVMRRSSRRSAAAHDQVIR